MIRTTLTRRGPVAPLPIIGYRKNGCPIYPIAGGDGTQVGNPVLERLKQQRDDQIRFMEELLSRVESEKRDLVKAEQDNLTSTRARIKELDDQIEPLEDFEKLRGAHETTTRRYRPAVDDDQAGDTRMGARTEQRGHKYASRGEIVVDIIRSSGVDPSSRRQMNPDRGAHERLVGAMVAGGSAEDEVRALAQNTTVETPGLLPKLIVGEVINDIDAARPFISSIGAKDLGQVPGKVFTRPVVTQHVVSGKQTAELAELPTQQFKVGGVDFTKETRGGALRVSRQDIDWTSPTAWDLIIEDLQEVYSLDTEQAASSAFAAAIGLSQEVELAGLATADPTIDAIISGLYTAAAGVYGSVSRLPNRIWMSLDRWAVVGAAIDKLKAGSYGNGGGDSSVDSFEGNLLRLPRVVVPSFPAGTIIVGAKERTEFYEERIGFLQAVLPSLLGVELAYGGYCAYGTLKPEGFRKLVNKV